MSKKKEKPDSTAPDAGQLRDQTLPEETFPGDAMQTFRVFFDPGVHEQAHEHAAEDKSVEICGVLVGQWKRDAQGPYVAISAALRGEAASNKSAEVTFTHDTWNRINQQMDTTYRDRSVVGWYHTHPDFGIFLSDRDRFIHEHFFSSPGQVAFVIDPVRKTEGVFIWSKGQPTPCSHFWIGPRLRMGDPEEDLERRQGDAREQTESKESKPPATQVIPNDARGGSGTMMALLLALAALALGYFFASRQNAADNLTTLAQAVILKNGKLGLSESLSQVNQELDAAAQTAGHLREHHLALTRGAPDEAAVGAAWNALTDQMSQGQRNLSLLKLKYGLSEEETMAIFKLAESRMAAAAAAQTQPQAGSIDTGGAATRPVNTGQERNRH